MKRRIQPMLSLPLVCLDRMALLKEVKGIASR
jgi:hypothetical protein